MTKFRSLFSLVAALGLMLGAPVFSGCTGPNRAAYQSVTVARVTVETAMGAFNVWVGQQKAKGISTVKEELVVKAAFEKVKASAIFLSDAGKAMAAGATGTTTQEQLSAAFQQAVSDFSQDKTDLVSLISSFGIKL